MDSNPKVTLPPEFIEKSWDWARQCVEDYAAGRNANSRAVTCFDAHTDRDLQAYAKMAECAFALWAGADPTCAIHWGRVPDNGFDLFWRGRRCDVKNTKMTGQYLIWPIGKNHIYQSKKFDVLVLVKHDVPLFEISGWISKTEFLAVCDISIGDVLKPGTWNVHQSELYRFEENK